MEQPVSSHASNLAQTPNRPFPPTQFPAADLLSLEFLHTIPLHEPARKLIVSPYASRGFLWQLCLQHNKLTLQINPLGNPV